MLWQSCFEFMVAFRDTASVGFGWLALCAAHQENERTENTVWLKMNRWPCVQTRNTALLKMKIKPSSTDRFVGQINQQIQIITNYGIDKPTNTHHYKVWDRQTHKHTSLRRGLVLSFQSSEWNSCTIWFFSEEEKIQQYWCTVAHFCGKHKQVSLPTHVHTRVHTHTGSYIHIHSKSL